MKLKMSVVGYAFICAFLFKSRINAVTQRTDLVSGEDLTGPFYLLHYSFLAKVDFNLV